jgi:hypothetical protein
MDTWTVYASSGEYQVAATGIAAALAAFTREHGNDDFVAAIVSDGMQPRLVLEAEA